MMLSKEIINKKLKKRIDFIIGNDLKIIKFNSIEIELCKYYLLKMFCKYDTGVSNNTIFNKFVELDDNRINYCQIQKFGIRFNYTPNLIDIIKAIILKYYYRFFICKKK